MLGTLFSQHFLRHYPYFTYAKMEAQLSNLSKTTALISSEVTVVDGGRAGKRDKEGTCLRLHALAFFPQHFLSSPQVPGTNRIPRCYLDKMPEPRLRMRKF